MLGLVDRLSNRDDPGFVNRTQPGGPAGCAAVPVRRACAADLAALRDFFAGLSERTRYLRFFGALTMTPALLRLLSGDGSVDSVVATIGSTIIGHGLAADRAGPDGATITEIGVVVADAWQGQGVGSALVSAIIAGARARGAATVAMDVLPGNQRVLAMIAGRWPAARIDHAADCVTIHARIPGCQDEQPRAHVTSQSWPGPPGTAGRYQRRPARPAARLAVAGSRTLRAAGRDRDGRPA